MLTYTYNLFEVYQLTQEPQNTDPNDANLISVDDGNTATDETAQQSENITLRREHIQQDLDALLKSDNNFQNAYNTSVGRAAKRQSDRMVRKEWAPQVETLKRELEAERIGSARKRLGTVDPARVAELLEKNPEFKDDYMLVNGTDAVASVTAQNNPSNDAFRQRMDDALATGERRGLSVDDSIQLETAVADGKFDTDERGKKLTMDEQIDKLSDVIFDRTSSLGTRKPDAPAPAPDTDKEGTTQVARGNAALQGGGPDMTPPAGGGGTSAGKWSRAEIDAMNPEQLLKEFPMAEDDIFAQADKGNVTGFDIRGNR